MSMNIGGGLFDSHPVEISPAPSTLAYPSARAAQR
jgi:hypothetical protein